MKNVELLSTEIQLIIFLPGKIFNVIMSLFIHLGPVVQSIVYYYLGQTLSGANTKSVRGCILLSGANTIWCKH